MNNENFEDKVLSSKKGGSKKTFYVVAGLLVLGVVSLFGGIKILSKISVSADTDTPPIPGDPFTVTPTATDSGVVSATPAPSSSTTSQPPTPPTPGPTISVTIPAGWSMIPGYTLDGKDTSAFGNAGIFIYSYNDPEVPNRDWIISNPDYHASVDYFGISSSISFWAHPALGYYVYNPGSARTLELATATHTAFKSPLIFGRGWHLMYWPGASLAKDDLLSRYELNYNDTDGGIQVKDATSESFHSASVKVYVVTNQNGLNNSSVKELTGTDSATTISKIPAQSYFWIYLRRTKVRVTNIRNSYTTTDPIVPPAPPSITPNPNSTSVTDLPPMPQG